MLNEIKALLAAGDTPAPEDIQWLIREAECAESYRRALRKIVEVGTQRPYAIARDALAERE